MRPLVVAFVLFLLIPLTVHAGAAGIARSVAELEQARSQAKQTVNDYNRSNEGTQWKAAFVYCVCSEDRSQIRWAYELLLFRDNGGIIVNHLRRAVSQDKRCGPCFATNPALEFIE
jgi:hypothetical protein